MDLGRLKTRLSSFWALNILGWLAFAVFSVVFSYRGPWTDVRRVLILLAAYLTGLIVSIPLRYFYKGIRLHERPLASAVSIALAASFVGMHLWMGVDYLVGLFLPAGSQPPTSFVQFYMNYVFNGGFFLLAWTSVYFGLKARRAWKQQQQRTERASALAQAAQLQMLRYQLNPHFLFNAMNSIRALVDEDEAKAREMITELSEFLRYSLDSKDYSDVALKNEIEAIRHYFAIQKKRYEDKLEVTYDVEPQAGEYPVLSFLIHPLVENAVKYGMRTSPLPLVIELKAKISDGGLQVEVSNTGRWIEPGGPERQAASGTGTGLENIRLRLENAFPHRHHFEVIEKEGRVCVQLGIDRPAGAADEKL